MIRSFLFAIGILIGLALAMASQARVSHLRSLARILPLPLPVWSQSLGPETGLWQGQKTGENGTVLNWQFHEVSREGMQFDITLDDGEQTLKGRIKLPFTGPPFVVENLQGGMEPQQGLAVLQTLVPLRSGA